VIAADESYEKWPWRYFIKAYLPGKEWAAVAQGTAAQGAGAEALTKARFQLGEAVAALHQIRFASFGELDDRAEVPEPLPFPDALEQRALRMIASPQAQDFVLSMLARKTALFQEIHTPALCHEDLHQYNLLLNWLNGEWCLVGILDFEKAWAGDREIDLARMDLWQMTGEPFWKAYQEHYPVDNGFADRKAVYQLIWCVEYAEDSAEQLDITQRLCQFLGLPVIKSFQPFQVKI
jgi:fructosamine-3-kinase